MYHWNISEPGPFHWRFCIRTSGTVIVDRVPIIELHVQYEQNTSTLYHGESAYIVPGPRFGEIHLCHPAEDRYLEYSEFMFEENPPPYIMELWPNLRTESINVFSGLRLRSMNYLGADEGQGWVETQWVFSNSSVVVNGEMIAGESPLVAGDIMHLMHQPVIVPQGGIFPLDTDFTELITMESRLHGWANMPQTEQKLDWREFGF